MPSDRAKVDGDEIDSVGQGRSELREIRVRVVDAGGGEVRVLVARDTENYPDVGTDAILMWEVAR